MFPATEPYMTAPTNFHHAESHYTSVTLQFCQDVKKAKRQRAGWVTKAPDVEGKPVEPVKGNQGSQ
eukprot:1157634-Pelagomonas_calceolata.AAC.3